MEPYCLVLFLESEEVGTVIPVPESKIDIARRQGWHVMGRDSEIPYIEPRDIDPAQSNPRRTED